MKKNLIFLFALTAVLTACTNDDSSEPQEITLDAGISLKRGTTRSSSADDYISSGTNFAAGVNIDLFLNDDGSATKTYDNALCYLKTSNATGGLQFYSAADRTATESKYLPASGSNVNFYAWYPAGVVTNITSNGSLTLTANQGAADASDNLDLMIGLPASNPVARTNVAVPLTFTHCLSKVTVVLQGDGSGLAVADAQLTGGTVTLGSTLSSAVTINPTTGACTKSGTADQTFTLKSAGNTALTNWAVVAPGETLTGMTITITLANGGSKTYTIPQEASSDVVTAAGKEYKYTFTIGLYTLTVTSTITDWTNQVAATETLTI